MIGSCILLFYFKKKIKNYTYKKYVQMSCKLKKVIIN
jgi:hypothetical protein